MHQRGRGFFGGAQGADIVRLAFDLAYFWRDLSVFDLQLHELIQFAEAANRINER